MSVSSANERSIDMNRVKFLQSVSFAYIYIIDTTAIICHNFAMTGETLS